MSTTDASPWARFEAWSGPLFLVAGGLWLLDTVSLVVNRFLGGTGVTMAMEGVAFVAALVATAIGVLGFYSRLSDATPRLALAGLGAIGSAMGGLGVTIALSTVMPTDSAALIALFVLSVVALLTGFLVFGIASVLAATPSRAVGLLLLSVTVIFVVWVVANVGVGGEPPNWLIVGLAAVITLVTLALGFRLRTEDAGSEPPERVDTAA